MDSHSIHKSNTMQGGNLRKEGSDPSGSPVRPRQMSGGPHGSYAVPGSAPKASLKPSFHGSQSSYNPSTSTDLRDSKG